MSDNRFLATNYLASDGVTVKWPFSFAGVNPDAQSGTVPYLYAEDVHALMLWRDASGNQHSQALNVRIDQPNVLTILGDPVPVGRTIKIYRRTEIRFPLVDYRDLQSVSEADLDLSARQAIFVAQEATDAALNDLILDNNDNYDASGRRVVNVAPGIDSRDAVNMQQLGLTLRVPSDETRVAPLPAAAQRSGKVLGFDTAGRPTLTQFGTGTAGDLSLELKGPDGAKKIGIGKWDTVESAIACIVSIKRFGGIGDGKLHPLSERYQTLAAAKADYPNVPITSLTESIDWAATWACFEYAAFRAIIILDGVFVLNKAVKVRTAPKIIAPGRNREWNSDRTINKGFDPKTGAFIAVGTGLRECTSLGVTNGRNNGGVWANPDAVHGIDGEYAMVSFHNDDGTPRLFSALFQFTFGTNSADWQAISIICGFTIGNDPLAGHKTQANGWGDDWDMGVYIDNGRHNVFTDVQFIGYWRIAGCYVRSGALDTEPNYVNSGVFAGAEENKFTNCVFQGHKSCLNRSIDMYKAIEVTGTYIAIPYAPGSPFLQHRRLRVGEFSGQFFTLADVVRVGDTLRLFTNGSPVGKVAVGDPVAPSYHGNGVAGTVYRDCRAQGMNHASQRRCSDPWHTQPLPPSACVEISGTRIRGLRFETTKVQTVDDIGVHAHQCIDLHMYGMRMEGDPDVNGIGGIRMLSTNVDYVHYIRDTYRVQMTIEQSGADMRPAPSERPNKFPTEIVGMWRPTLCGLDGRQGVFIGGYADANKIYDYVRGGFTVALRASDGDLTTSGVVRHGTQARTNDMVTLQLSFYSGNFSYTTGNGQLEFTIPRAVAAFAGTLRIPLHGEGNKYDGRGIFIELVPGSTVATLFMFPTGSNNPVPLTPARLAASGSIARISGVITYQCVV